jgi:hypothetical protein
MANMATLIITIDLSFCVKSIAEFAQVVVLLRTHHFCNSRISVSFECKKVIIFGYFRWQFYFFLFFFFHYRAKTSNSLPPFRFRIGHAIISLYDYSPLYLMI